MTQLAKKQCVPCEGGIDPYTPDIAQEMLKELSEGWMLIDDAHLLVKEYRFDDFKDAMSFANKVADTAEEENHHPDLAISWGSVSIELSTHAIGGLSENDFILASKIDLLG
jgi:4a-hydroxytetrahydrobiopterin dehydratase